MLWLAVLQSAVPVCADTEPPAVLGLSELVLGIVEAPTEEQALHVAGAALREADPAASPKKLKVTSVGRMVRVL